MIELLFLLDPAWIRGRLCLRGVSGEGVKPDGTGCGRLGVLGGWAEDSTVEGRPVEGPGSWRGGVATSFATTERFPAVVRLGMEVDTGVPLFFLKRRCAAFTSLGLNVI